MDNVKTTSLENLRKLQVKLNEMNPVDIAEELKTLPKEQVAIWVKLLKKDLLADSFTELNKKNKLRIIEILSDESTKELIKELDEDELVDTLQELPANIVRRLMSNHIDSSRRPIINELLGYPEDSIGSIMTVNYLSVKETDSPKDVINKVTKSKLDAHKLEQIWLTNESLVLIGYLKLADLIRNPDSSIKDLSNNIIVSVTPYEDQEIVAKLAYKYNIAEIPVVDSENRLVGILPVEDIIEVVHDELQEDISNITGISSTSESYLDESSFAISKARTTWLVICLLTATFTGFIIKRYEALLASSVVLTAYIPMLMDSGGNAGSQSSTTVITSMYAGQIKAKDALKVIIKESQVGLISGAILVAINFLRMSLLDSVPLSITITVSITLLLTIVLSKVMGAVLPIIAEKLKIDPTVMAGPLITTVVDTFVLIIYFEVAKRFLNL